MAKSREPVPVGDDQVRALLERYACPVPFHEVRTRFLGNIASPVLTASPMVAVRELWGGELPEFSDMDAELDPSRYGFGRRCRRKLPAGG